MSGAMDIPGYKSLIDFIAGTITKEEADALLDVQRVARAEAGLCPWCGGKKGADLCMGNDECANGPGGTPAKCCEGWGTHCCKCGKSFAMGQI